MMDCTQAQATISEALDGGTFDHPTLEAAKQHCRECPDCTAFVHGLNAVKRAPLPEPDPALVDRVMTAVRREAAAQAASAAAAAPAREDAAAAEGGAESVAPAAVGPAGAPDETSTAAAPSLARSRTRPRPATLAVWIAAAAVLVVGAGTIGIMGVRLMTQSQTASTRTQLEGTGGPSGTNAAVQDAVPAAPQSGSTGSVGEAPSYITFSGTVYRLVGVSTTTKSELTRVGSTTSSLDGERPLVRAVLQKPGGPSAYVEDDQEKILEFEPVEREFEGRSYRLQSPDLGAFGTWPSLPTDIPEPTAADGSPTFTAAGTDSSGVSVYRLTSSTTAQGIAVAPGSSPSDPANGNPGWTWWTPSH